jgi:UDP-2,3-diacylglucosamine hydrolase
MKTLVFADVHLKVDAANRAAVDEFVAFLRSIDPAEFERLIVVGDLFDFWFEYRHAMFSGYFDVLRALADLRDHGVECHLVCGNHDLWAGRFFERELGVRVHRDSYAATLGDRRVLFIHGDGVNPADAAYKAYKRVAQSWIASAAFRLLHPDWAMAIAQRVSSTSRHLKSPNDRADSAEVVSIREFARSVIERGEAEVVICGHTHYPACEEFASPDGRGLYINTGGWLDDRAFWIWDNGEFTRYCGLLTDRRRAPVSRSDERQGVAPGAVNVAREEPDQT